MDNMEHISSQNGAETGESYNYSDQELIRLLVKSRQAQNKELEYEDLDGYKMPPRTQFSMLKKPAVSIRKGKLTFNMACIRLFEGVEFILPLVHLEKKKLTIIMCTEEESSSVPWAKKRRKDGEWANKDINSPDFVYNLFRLMNWNEGCRYKVLGHVANSARGLVLVFELEEAIMFASKPEEYVDEETGAVKKRQVKYYPDYYKHRIGRSYTDYLETRQINMFESLEEYSGKTYDDFMGEEKGETVEATDEETIGEVSPLTDAGTDVPDAEQAPLRERTEYPPIVKYADNT